MQQGIRRTAVALALAVGVAGAAHAQTADELVAKNLKAKGGLDNLKAVQGMKITGRVTLPGAGGGGGMEIPMTIVTKRPNRFRQESEFKGQKIVVAFDGTKAWMINPMMGQGAPQPIEGERLDMVKQQADLDGPLVDYKAKGTTIEVQGVETVDGKKVHKLKVTPKTGRRRHAVSRRRDRPRSQDGDGGARRRGGTGRAGGDARERLLELSDRGRPDDAAYDPAEGERSGAADQHRQDRVVARPWTTASSRCRPARRAGAEAVSAETSTCSPHPSLSPSERRRAIQ